MGCGRSEYPRSSGFEVEAEPARDIEGILEQGEVSNSDDTGMVWRPSAWPDQFSNEILADRFGGANKEQHANCSKPHNHRSPFSSSTTWPTRLPGRSGKCSPARMA